MTWLVIEVMMLLVVCQLSLDAIWLRRLVTSLVRFDPSIVTVKQSFIVSQIVGCSVILFVVSFAWVRQYQSLLTTVPFRTTFTRTIILNLLMKWLLGPFLESPDNFSGPKKCFMFSVMIAFNVKVSIILKMIQWIYQSTKQIYWFVS